MASKKNLKKAVNHKLKIDQLTALERDQVGYMARALVQATLPHRATSETFFKRTNGSYQLQLSKNDEKIGLPYGVYPRLILAYLSTEVVKTQQRTVVLGDSMSQFMKKLSIVPTGGRWGSINGLKEQVRRLANCNFKLSQVTIDEQGVHEEFENLSIAKSGSFHWAKNPDQQDLWESSITLSEDFYEEIVNHPVPIDLEVLKAIRRSPMALDIYSWLTFRTSYQKGRSKPIKWESLQQQFGADYPNTKQGTRSFKHKFLKHLNKVTKFYEGANVEIVDNGLVLNSGKPSVAKRLAK